MEDGLLVGLSRLRSSFDCGCCCCCCWGAGGAFFFISISFDVRMGAWSLLLLTGAGLFLAMLDFDSLGLGKEGEGMVGGGAGGREACPAMAAPCNAASAVNSSNEDMSNPGGILLNNSNSGLEEPAPGGRPNGGGNMNGLNPPGGAPGVDCAASAAAMKPASGLLKSILPPLAARSSLKPCS